MQTSKRVYGLISLTLLAGAASPLSALCNNVLVVPDAQHEAIQGSWLAERLPEMKQTSTVGAKEATASQTKPYIEPFSGEIKFTPDATPGAAFRQSGEEFSEYRKKFTPEF